MKRGPLFRYFGGKWSRAKLYGEPSRPIVVEPFAGGAGYSLYWKCPSVTLVEKDPCIANIWNYLISDCRESDFDSIPDDCWNLEDIPGAPEPLRDLVGMWFALTPEKPRRKMGPTHRINRTHTWSAKAKQRIINELPLIRNWRLIEGDYTLAPDSPDHFSFIDPPYQRRGGDQYVHGNASIDYSALADWCRGRSTGVVCESMEADWLNFECLSSFKNQQSKEYREGVYWIQSRSSSLASSTAALNAG